jgi:demethylmenaquinone methyltransferase/2-methoxy-6-polyprenyl-1,4-benzoquinol methylase
MSSVQAEPTPTVDKRGERVRRMFAEIAPRYDLLNRLLSLRIDQSWRRTTVKLAPPDPASRLPILDLCTGTGDLALAYAKSAPNVKVVGADFCAPMLDLARRKAAKANLPVEFVEADGLDLPFADAEFQLVSVAFGLRNMSDTDRGLREIRRVLAPGGSVAILEFSKPTALGLKQTYEFYFRRVLPWIGQRLARNRQSAYEYLPASVMEFPDGQALLDRLAAVGFTELSAKPLTFGIATLYIGRRPVGD